MNLRPCSFSTLLILLCCGFASSAALAEPIDYREVSLLVRAGESEPSITQEVRERKLVRALTPQQEATLRKQGASETLIQALRSPDVVLSQSDAADFDARRKSGGADSQAAANQMSTSQASGANPDIQIIEVSHGFPVNLSYWGGPACEFSFHSPTRLDEGREDALLIYSGGTFIHSATYLGVDAGGTWLPAPRTYTAATAHTYSQAVRIDRRRPVVLKGFPYTLYPVYAAGGVSLYYIGSTSRSVKLAVSRGML